MHFDPRRFRVFTKTNERYDLRNVFKGHGAPINSIAFNTTCSLLATGGDDEEVRLWDMENGQQLQSLMDQNGRWGQITKLSFLYPDGGSLGSEWLVFGTGRGLFLIYRRIRKTREFNQISSTRVSSAGDSVESFEFDNHHQRLVVTSHYGKIRMYKFNNGNLTDLWGEEFSEIIPRAVSFADKGETLLIFCMETGTIVYRDAETAAEKATKVLPSCIICPTTGNFMVDNMKNGFDIYPPSRTSPTKSFSVAATKKYVKQGVFGERGKIAVCGSDHGNAYLFGMSSSEILQVLKHGKKDEMIQAVQAASTVDKHFIATGSSNGKFQIQIWEKSIRPISSRNEAKGAIGILTVLNLIFFLVVLWATSDTWLPPVSEKMNIALSQTYQSLQTHITALKPTPSADDIQRLLAEMDEETLQKVLGKGSK
ncbi:hypothetical protein NLJ89_g213 [Agrocybe chaxingu]|uniref:WD40 repeat-like protein n=1 Tax=Agrocybe chaxingu TaxID=84603 RepID=A0A9W8N2A6_9AGAR|nr:hypothetical protein NLJ89_g213 [Agrocybe chaxingu]